MLRELLQIARALEAAGRDVATQDEGIAGRDMQEAPGSGSPWAMPPITGSSIRRPPGSDSPFSWP